MVLKEFLPLFVLVVFAGATACTRSPQAYVERGDKLFADGKYEDALLNYQKAVQLDPKFGRAYYRQGQVQIQTQQFRDAYRSLLRAVELMPANDRVKVTLADLCLASYLADPNRPKALYDQASKIAQELRAKVPSHYDALRLSGRLALIDRKTKEGIEYLRSANQARPMEPEVVLALADALIEDGQAAEAERLVLELIDKRKDHGPAYDLLAAYYENTRQPGKAEQILKTKAVNNPTDADYALQLAWYYRTRKPADMRATLQRLLDNPVDFPNGRLQVGNFYAQALGDWGEAVRQFEEGIKASPEQRIVFQKRITAVLLAQGKKEEAARMVEAILREAPKEDDALSMRAALQLESGKQEGVMAALEGFQSLVKRKPEDPMLRFSLGRAHLVAGDLDAARRELLEALRLERNYPAARVLLAEVALQKKQPQDAIRYADQALIAQPDNGPARLVRASALIQREEYREARQELTRLVRERPDFTDAQVLLARLNVTEKRFQEAEAIFRTLYRSGQADTRPLEGLVAVHFARRQPEQALDLLREELRKSPRREVREILVRAAVESGRYDLAIEECRELLRETPDVMDLHLRLGDAYHRKGDLAQAITSFQKAAEIAPKNARPRILHASVLEKAGRREEAIVEYRRALELDAENAAVMNNLAFLLAERGDLDEALTLARRATEKARDQAYFADTLGWVYLKKNMTDSALQIFQNLAAKHPENPTFRYHLGMALLAKGERQRARSELEAALSKKPNREEEARIKEALTRIG